MQAKVIPFIMAIFSFSSIESIKIKTCDNNVVELSKEEAHGFVYLTTIGDEVDLPFTEAEFRALVKAGKDPLFLEQYFATVEYASLLKAIDNTTRDCFTEDISLWLKLLPHAFDRRHDYSLNADLGNSPLIGIAGIALALFFYNIMFPEHPYTLDFPDIILIIAAGLGVHIFERWRLKNDLASHMDLCKKNNYWPIIVNEKHLKLLVSDTSTKRLDNIVSLFRHLFMNNAAARAVLNGETTNDRFCRRKVASIISALTSDQLGIIKTSVEYSMRALSEQTIKS